MFERTMSPIRNATEALNLRALMVDASSAAVRLPKAIREFERLHLVRRYRRSALGAQLNRTIHLDQCRKNKDTTAGSTYRAITSPEDRHVLRALHAVLGRK